MDVCLVQTKHFKQKVKCSTRSEDSYPFALTTNNLLSNPIHRNQHKTNNKSFEQDVHL